jgi:hypothetical protein
MKITKLKKRSMQFYNSIPECWENKFWWKFNFNTSSDIRALMLIVSFNMFINKRELSFLSFDNQYHSIWKKNENN